MEVIEIEKCPVATKPGTLEITGNSHTIKIQHNPGHIIYHGSDSCFYLDCRTGEQNVDPNQINELRYQSLEIVQLLIILLIFLIILKITDMDY